jgi:hypothetical protein
VTQASTSARGGRRDHLAGREQRLRTARQCLAVAEHGLDGVLRAVLVLAAGQARCPRANGPDDFALNDDGKATGDREIAHPLWSPIDLPVHALVQLAGCPTKLGGGFRFQLRRHTCVSCCPIRRLVRKQVAGRIDDRKRDRITVARCLSHARLDHLSRGNTGNVLLLGYQ